MRECLEVPIEGLVEEGLFQFVERGELAAVDGFQALGFGRRTSCCFIHRIWGLGAREPLTSCAAEMRRDGLGKALTGGMGPGMAPRIARAVARWRVVLAIFARPRQQCLE